MSNSSLITDGMVTRVTQDVAILSMKLDYLQSEVKELKDTNKQLLEFMQTIKAGRATLLMLIGCAASIGGIVGVGLNAVSKVFH